MPAVQELAAAILRSLPADVPDDVRTARALLLAGIAGLYEFGLSRDDVIQIAEGDWDVVDEALQNPCCVARTDDRACACCGPALIQH